MRTLIDSDQLEQVEETLRFRRYGIEGSIIYKYFVDPASKEGKKRWAGTIISVENGQYSIDIPELESM